MFLFIIGSILFLGYSVLIGLYKKWWDDLVTYEADPLVGEKPVLISIIVAARNEEANVGKLIAALQQQSYPQNAFEVLIVDDHSTDATAAIVEKTGGNVRPVSLAQNETSKKTAIAKGIASANGELIITTDADCLPPPEWLQTLAHFYSEKKAVFIAAPVKYNYRNNLLEVFQTLDFITLQGITAASVSSGSHTMCNGANLAYTKEAFNKVDGFTGIDAVASGDDMLLMHKIWKQDPDRVFYLKSKEAIVETAPMPTWRQFFWQRIRWASKTTAYDDKRIFWALLLVYLFNVLFVALVVAGIWNTSYLVFALALWVLKTVAEIPFIYSVATFFNQQKLVRYFFLFQPLHILYTVIIGALSQTGSYQWKGRKTK